jgi:hypothetical protein
VITEPSIEGSTLFLRGTHIEGKGTLKEAIEVARDLGGRAKVDRVVVEPGRRTTGARPGHLPRPIIIEVQKK